MRIVEIYIGYTNGTWDTEYIDVPSKVLDKFEDDKDITNELASLYEKHLDTLSIKTNSSPSIAFVGVYNIPSEEED